MPGPAGAVLEYRTQVAKATLLPKSSTPLMSINSQFLFYVVSGEGRLDDGTQSWDLRNGITMLIPPDVKRRFVNTSDEPLEMVMAEWPANAIARKDILVRDVTLLPYCEENAHWNNMSKCVFTAGRRHDGTRAARDADADDDGGAASAWTRHRRDLDEDHAGQFAAAARQRAARACRSSAPSWRRRTATRGTDR